MQKFTFEIITKVNLTLEIANYYFNIVSRFLLNNDLMKYFSLRIFHYEIISI